MKRSWSRGFAAVVIGVTAVVAGIAAQAQKQYVFAHFKEPGDQGIYLAISKDGYHYEDLNGGQPWVKPQFPGELMRDVFLTRGPDGMYRMVWTWDWKGQSLGYAESPDLLHWSAQRQIPVMTSIPNTRNVWAPEMDWDAKKKVWVIFWSSSPKDVIGGNRIWATRTADFKTFTLPKIFFDPGYEVIDATMYHGKRKTYLVFKDQTRDPLRYQIRYATGPGVEGPWSDIHAPVTSSWSEGPSVVKVGKEYVIYYDHYRPPHAQYQGVESTDWIHWENIDDRISFPALSKHGSFLEVSAAEAALLRSRQ